METRKCHWCDNTATRPDYREVDGMTSKVPTCEVCFALNTNYVLKKKQGKIAKKIGDTFHVKICGHSFEFVPEEEDWWTSGSSPDSKFHFDLHYCEEYAQISAYPVQAPKGNWVVKIEKGGVEMTPWRIYINAETQTEAEKQALEFDKVQDAICNDDWDWNLEPQYAEVNWCITLESYKILPEDFLTDY